MIFAISKVSMQLVRCSEGTTKVAYNELGLLKESP
jgi:hypothetical protein